MFVTFVVLYAFVGFLITTAILRDETMRDGPMAFLALAVGVFWIPVTVAAIALVAMDAALACRRV